MSVAYIALGSNLGDPVATVQSATASLRRLPRSTVIAASSLYRTEPLGLRNQPDFINAVVAVETQLNPRQLLDELFAIEGRFGRNRSILNAPRTLDLDVLLHGNTISNDPQITLPHPRLHLRAFVLAPLAEIAPGLFLPGHGDIRLLLNNCSDQKIETMTVAA